MDNPCSAAVFVAGHHYAAGGAALALGVDVRYRDVRNTLGLQVVEGFRWALRGKTNPSVPLLLLSTSVVALMIFGGLEYFRGKKTFADIV